ncbi:hypothetical protein PAAG_01957 [Paracoccidioides lutzii Pb01]|uniref:Uncharacterized protein n=1 Tax=Paracoccidioides lutzii (strain ATCC MYA-826 / Pb01) TaxID=502779 RepID=C1GTW2_PARBA|nr:hypothetical protein PAAG_01957 [Paracoccidioides lutzii Pb01]EEH39768.2 hypothetical protein PAAG_01957 [Paracoccidioides lutzii Pb01]
MASELSKDTIVKAEDVVAQMITEKELTLVEQSKKNMYIEDIAEFTQVILIITEMTYVCGWQCIQMVFFLQLAVITASCPSAILHLQYQDIVLTLIQVPDSGRPQLNEFKISEIIWLPENVRLQLRKQEEKQKRSKEKKQQREKEMQ